MKPSCTISSIKKVASIFVLFLLGKGTSFELVWQTCYCLFSLSFFFFCCGNKFPRKVFVCVLIFFLLLLLWFFFLVRFLRVKAVEFDVVWDFHILCLFWWLHIFTIAFWHNHRKLIQKLTKIDWIWQNGIGLACLLLLY